MRRSSVSLYLLITVGVIGLCVANGCPGPEPQAADVGGGTTSTTGSTSSTGTPSGTGTGAACECPAFDVLFVVDNTHSFWELYFKFVPLSIQVGPAIQSLLDRACSLHVGVVTATPQLNNPAECQALGDLSRINGDDEPCETHNGRYLTEDDTDAFADLLLCLLYVGLDGNDGEERPIEALFAALDPERNADGACNAGFLREGAPLLIIIISDADDNQSELDGVAGPDDPDDWFADLVQLKGTRDIISTIAIIGPAVNPGSDAGAGGSCAAEPAVRLREFLENGLPSHTAVLDVCDPDAAAVIDALEQLPDQYCPEAR